MSTQSASISRPPSPLAERCGEARGLAAFGTAPGAVLAALLVTGLVVLFHDWFLRQHRFSMKHPQDWGHAYLVPVISLYLLWQHRAELEKTEVRTFWPGLAAMLVGIVTYFFFTLKASSNHMFQGGGLILTVFGLVLLLAGPRVMRYAFLPIAYLGFGVTLSDKLMTMVTFKLQLVASQGAYVLLSMIGAVFGFHTDVSGNTLSIMDSAGIVHPPLNVAEACSGMRMVIAFLALGAAVALVGCKHWWQRIALFMFAAPVAVLMNVLRVAILGILSLFNDEWAKGDAHMLIGTLLLVPSLLLYLGIAAALNRVLAQPGVKGSAA